MKAKLTINLDLDPQWASTLEGKDWDDVNNYLKALIIPAIGWRAEVGRVNLVIKGGAEC